jgi:hypothetical protein
MAAHEMFAWLWDLRQHPRDVLHCTDASGLAAGIVAFVLREVRHRVCTRREL